MGAQMAHVEAMRRATAEAKSEKPEGQVSAVANRSCLGLEALKERKAIEEEERQLKRDAARAKRRNEASKKEVEDEAAIQECEEQATQDCVENARVKYKAALIVRIACKFGTSGVWMKIAEARARGANIPLDPRRIYLLAHPDKCPLAEASDATAILNAQRPPEMTEVKAPKAAPKKEPPAASASAPGPEATAHPVSEDVRQQKSEAQTGYEERCSRRAAQGVVAQEAQPELTTRNEERAAQEAQAEDKTRSEEKRVDPEDQLLCTLQELHQKYEGVYSPQEIEAYWKDECKPKPRTRRF